MDRNGVWGLPDRERWKGIVGTSFVTPRRPPVFRLIVPLVSFGTPWPNKQNHKTLHFQNFLNEKFIAASIKITVFKIKAHFTEYSSVISSLSIILTEICIFSKIFKRIFYKNKKKFAYFQHAFYIQLNVDT